MLKKLTIAVLAVIIIGAGVSLFFVIKYSKYDGIDKTNLIEERMMEKVDYERYLEGVLKVGRDGVSYINSKGNLVWTQAFLISNPKVDIRSDKVVIADIKGNHIFVFNDKGKISDFSVPFTIIDATVAKNGVVAVAMEDKLYNPLYLYDSLGGIIAKSRTSVEKDGIPLSIAISQDGAKLATSYLHTERTQANSRITFYRFDDVGKNHIDKFLGSFTNEDMIVPQIEFINNDTLVAFSDNKVIIYDANYIPAIAKEINLEEEIAAVLTQSEYISIITKDKENKTSNVRVYDLEGKLVGQVNTSLEFVEVLINDGEIIVNGKYHWEIYNFRGKLKYKGEFQEEVEKILPIKKGRYIVVSINKVEEITLK